MIPFDQTRKELWLQYEAKADFLSREQELYELLGDSEGDDQVVIYCRKERAVKRLPQGRNIHIDSIILNRLTNYLGESCVKVIEKPIENNR